MSLTFDIHLHTRRYSQCSAIDPEKLIGRAVQVGLDGVVITEHHHQWDDDELAQLVEASGHEGFILLAGFEYTSSKGDLLVYGLVPGQEKDFKPGGSPEETADRVQALGGICVAAHPTRENLGFDERLATLPLAAMEVASVNLASHEQHLAASLAETLEIRPISSSDAHELADVGRYGVDFTMVVQNRADLKDALGNGKFHMVGKRAIR